MIDPGKNLMERIGPYLAYVYLLRIPLLTWAVLFVLPLLALPKDAALGSLLKGIFDIGADNVWQTPLSFFLVSTASLLTAATIGVTARLIILDGEERFGAGHIPRRRESGADGIKLMLRVIPLSVAVPLVAGASYQTLKETHPAMIPAALSGIIFGFLLFYFVMTLLQDEIWAQIFPTPTGELSPVTSRLRKLRLPFYERLMNYFVSVLAGFADLGRALVTYVTTISPQGYIDPRTRELRHRHIFALIQLVISIVFYFSLFLIKKYAPAGETAPVIPTLCLLLILAMMLCWGLSALTFFLDRFRIPVLVPLVIWSWTVAVLPQGDHFYSSLPKGSATTTLLPAQVLSPREGKPVVLVAASGGGIQSAAWTARVLAGLRREFEKQSDKAAEEFDRSIRLISAVSGGAVGAMYIVDAYQANGQLPKVGEQLDYYKPLKAAEASSLDDVAWGLVYPDFLWSLVPFWKGFYFYPFYLVNGPNLVSDRGTALENAWKRTDSLATATLSRWQPEVGKGNKPAVVFNATIVETGERLLLSTTDFEPFREPTNKVTPGWQEFSRLYPEMDIAIVTAARLSATFPFVTPAARILRGDVFADQYHVVDGGYYDNYGVATLIEWLNRAMNAGGSKPSRILILQIRGSPAGLIDPPTGDSGWFFQATHAFQTLANVRGTGQFARNEVELKFLQQLCSHVYNIPCTVVAFEYYRTDRHSDQIPAPLSWHLTPSDIVALREEWNRQCPSASAQPLIPRNCDRVLEFFRQ
jgi:Patatin-like phospholipase